MKEQLIAFLKDEEGLTVVEYAIAGGLVSAAVIGAFQLLGDKVFEVIDFLGKNIGVDGGGDAGGGAAGG